MRDGINKNILECGSANGAEPIFFEPIFVERVWGGTALRDRLGYEFLSDKIGECWAISAVPGFETKALTGEYYGKTIKQIFADKTEEFPLLVKIIDASDDLSVQVHPNDDYAKKRENSFGKTECWYILETSDDNASIVYGHTAQTRGEMEQKISENKWNELLKSKDVKTGDFVFVEAGKVHAIKKGVMLLEIQQSSDITYRLYDYERLDDNGEKRELHIDKALDAVLCPDREYGFSPRVETAGDNLPDGGSITVTTLAVAKQFTVKKYEIDGVVELTLAESGGFAIVCVVAGEGLAGMSPVRRGSIFMLVCDDSKQVKLSGGLTVLVVTV